jgi:hypothetical protein
MFKGFAPTTYFDFEAEADKNKFIPASHFKGFLAIFPYENRPTK